MENGHELKNGCPICGCRAARIRQNKRGKLYVRCEQCGPINVHSDHAQEALQKLMASPKPEELGTVAKKMEAAPAESAGGGLFW